MPRNRSAGGCVGKGFEAARIARQHFGSLGGEMGRLPTIQVPVGDTELKKVGRDHNTYGFSMWVAGAGIKGGYVHGETDEFSHYAVKDQVTHHDWLATVLDRFGLDAKSLNFEVGAQKLSLVENPAARVVQEILLDESECHSRHRA